jgi:transposase-like protein
VRAGCCSSWTKRLLESALEGEITDHLGYDKHDPVARTVATPATANAPRPS